MINGIHKALVHLADAFRTERLAAAEPAHGEAITSFAGSWHGDHLQNLLACPMDGRRYFIEDWQQEHPAHDETPRLDSFSGRPLRSHN